MMTGVSIIGVKDENNSQIGICHFCFILLHIINTLVALNKKILYFSRFDNVDLVHLYSNEVSG